MRPLIEILEDERTQLHKLESVFRYLVNTDDIDTIDILHAHKDRVEQNLAKTRKEIRAYLDELSTGGDLHE